MLQLRNLDLFRSIIERYEIYDSPQERYLKTKKLPEDRDNFLIAWGLGCGLYQWESGGRPFDPPMKYKDLGVDGYKDVRIILFSLFQ